ncbi:MAG: hypothetical protein ABJA66_15335 [Actinomycetota bacterium]
MIKQFAVIKHIWTKLVVATLLMFGLFGFSAMAQDNSKQPLDDEAATALVNQLNEGLPDLIEDEARVAAITEKWDEHEDLAGKTKAQILNLLFADVKTVIGDKKTLDGIWSEWQSAETEDEDKTVITPAVQPSAQPKDYVAQMTELISALNGEKTGDEFEKLSLQFEKIGDAKKTEWLPYYYAAYALVIQARQEKELNVVDGLMDRSDTLLAKADSLSQRNSEIFLIRALTTQARMSVDSSRYIRLGPIATKLVKQSEAFNPENPRAYFMDAQMTYYTPENFSGGKAKGIALLELALKKFAAFKPENSLSPNWGREQAVYTLAEWNRLSK